MSVKRMIFEILMIASGIVLMEDLIIGIYTGQALGIFIFLVFYVPGVIIYSVMYRGDAGQEGMKKC